MAKYFFLSSRFFLLLSLTFLFFSSKGAKEKVVKRIEGADIVTTTAAIQLQDQKYPNPAQGCYLKGSRAVVMLGFDQYNKTALAANINHTVTIVVNYNKSDGSSASVGPLNLAISKTVSHYDDKAYISIPDAYNISVNITSVDGAAGPLASYIFMEASIEVERYYPLDLTNIPYDNNIGISQYYNSITNEFELSWDHLEGAEAYELEYTYVDDYSGVNVSTRIGAQYLTYDFALNSTRIITDKQFYNIPVVYDRGYLLYRLRGKGKGGASYNIDVYSKWSGDQFPADVQGFLHQLDIATPENSNWQSTASFAEEGKRKDVVSYFDGSLRNRQVVTKSNTTNKIIAGETIYDNEGRGVVQVLPVPVVPGISQRLKYIPDFNLNSAGVKYSKDDFDENGNCTTSTTPMKSDANSFTGAANYYSPNNPDKTNEKALIPDAGGYPFTQVEFISDNTGKVKKQSGLGSTFTIGSGKETEYIYGKPEQEELDRLLGTNAGVAIHYQKNIVIDPNQQASISYIDLAGKVVATSLAGDKPGVMDEVESPDNTQKTITVKPIRDCGDGTGNCNSGNSKIGTSLIFSKQITVISNNTSYDIDYSITPEAFDKTCKDGITSFCYDCVYDLEIGIKDECGTDMITPIKKTIGNLNNIQICSSVEYDTIIHELILNKGSYSFYKKLTVNEDALNAYLEDYFLNCAKTKDDFITDKINATDITGSCKEVDCSVCLMSLFYDPNQSIDNNYQAYVSSEKYEGDPMSREDYESALEDCQDLCDDVSTCQASYQMMLADMSPSGQYAATSSESENWSLSVFNDNALLPGWTVRARPFFRHPFTPYVDEQEHQSYIPLSVMTDPTDATKFIYEPAIYGAPVKVRYHQDGYYVADVNGDIDAVSPENLVNISDYVANFEESWAKSLVRYHPEYCYYESCIANDQAKTIAVAGTNYQYSSSDFDARLLQIDNYSDAATAPLAVILGVPNPLYNPKFNFALINSNVADVTDLLDKDPYFIDHPDQYNVMLNKLTDYQTSSTTLNVKQFVAITNRCGNLYYYDESATNCANQATTGEYYASCLNCEGFGTGTDDDLTNLEWESYSAFYLGEKQKLQQVAADEHCMNLTENNYNNTLQSSVSGINSCIENPNYSPYNLYWRYYDFNAFSWTRYFRSFFQPCGYITYSLYKNKTRRFPGPQQLEESLDICDSDNPVTTEVIRKAQLDHYLQTGQCPMTNDFESLLNGLAAKQKFTASSSYSLRQINSLSKGLYDYLRFTVNGISTIPQPTAVPYVDYSWYPSGSADPLSRSYSIAKTVSIVPNPASNVSIQIQAGQVSSSYIDNNGDEFQIDLSFNESPAYKKNNVTFSDGRFTTKIIGLRNVVMLNFNGSVYSFYGTMEMEIYDNISGTPVLVGTASNVRLTGTTNIALDLNCNFDNVCELTKEIKDVKNFLNVLAANQFLTTTSPVSFSDAANADLNEVFTESVKQYFLNPQAPHSFSANTPGSLFPINIQIFQLAPAQSDITINLSLASGTTYPGTSLNDIVGFSCLKENTGTAANNDFTITAITNTQVHVPLVGTITTVDKIPGTTINENEFKIMKCGPPLPESCKSIENDNRVNLKKFLVELLNDNTSSHINSVLVNNAAVSLTNNYSFATTLKGQLGQGDYFWRNVIIRDNSNVIANTGNHLTAQIAREVVDGTVSQWVGCDVELHFQNQPADVSFSNIVDITNIVADYSEMDAGKSYNFTATAVYYLNGAHSTTVINGKTCFALENCDMDCFMGKQNLVQNGDFSDPTIINTCEGTGFNTCYNLAISAAMAPGNARLGKTAVGVNGSHWRGLDHTTKDGYYLMVDAVANRKAWYTTVQVEAGQYYNFSAFVRNIWPLSGNGQKPRLSLYIGSLPQGGGSIVAQSGGEAVADQSIATRQSYSNYEFPDTSSNNANGNKRMSTNEVMAAAAAVPAVVCSTLAACAPVNGTFNITATSGYLNYNSDSDNDANDGWVKMESWYLATTTGSIEIGIAPTSDANGSGWDFGLDDVSFSRLCLPLTPGFPEPEEPVADDCVQQLTDMVTASAEDDYNRYVLSETENFRNAYIEKCLKAAETLQYTYPDKEYHYTLYYYDQAGNLVKTIPPAGVDVIDNATQIDQIFLDRYNNKFTYSIQPQHTLPTIYTYNSLNQLVTQSVPDNDKLQIYSAEDKGTIPAGFTIEGTQFKDAANGYLIASDNLTGKAHFFITNNGGTTWSELSNIGITDLKDVQMMNIDLAYAVGTDGAILKTENASTGNDWSYLPVGTTNELIKVHFFDDDHGITYEKNGYVWRTLDGGDTWTSDNNFASILSVKNSTLTDIHFSGNKGYAVTSDGSRGFIYESNDGITWTEIINIKSGNLFAVDMINDSKGFAGGTGVLLKTTDGGASWKTIANNLTSQNFVKLHFTDENNGSAILSDGHIWGTSDGGKTWVVSNLPASEKFVDYCFLLNTPSNGYAVSSQKSLNNIKKVYKTVDGGKSWLISPALSDLSALTLLSGKDAASIYFQDSNTGYVGAEGGVLYRTTNATAAAPVWSSVTFGIASTLRDIHFSDNNHGVLLLDNTKLYTTSNASNNNAPTWNYSNIDKIVKMDFTDANHGFALNNLGQIYITSDGGQTWGTVSVSPAVSSLNGIAAKSDGIVSVGIAGSINKTTMTTTTTATSTDVSKIEPLPLNAVHTVNGTLTYAVGSDGTVLQYNSITSAFEQLTTASNADLYALHMNSDGSGVAGGKSGSMLYSNGASWSNAAMPAAFVSDITNITFENISSTTGYAVADDGTILKTINSGAAWTVSGTSNYRLESIHFTSSTEGLAVGKNGVILKTLDAGASWNNATLFEPFELNATFLVKGTTIGYAVGKKGTIIKTNDIGQSWNALTSGTTVDLQALYFKNTKEGIVVGKSGKILKTINEGKNWSIATPVSTELTGIQASNNTVLVTGKSNGTSATLLRSTNFGTSWTSVTGLGNYDLSAVYLVDDNIAYAVGSAGTILRSSDGGQTWTAQIKPDNSNWTTENLKGVWFTNLKTGYAIGENGLLLKTFDAGLTWNIETSGTTEDLTQISFIDDNHAYISGSNAALVKVTDFSDEFSSRFWYDELGRLIVSQNAKQFNNAVQHYSYIRYDNLARIIEVGEIENPVDIETRLTHTQVNYADFEAWLLTGTSRKDVTKTYYDNALPGLTVPGFTQENLLKRVATSTYQRDGVVSTYDHAYHYSYDVQGNVNVMIQDVPYLDAFAQRFKRFDYDYDLITGKLNSMVYQVNRADQFIHRYEYDAENRITNVYTSSDDIVWAEDAKYFYYDHGPLARTEIGDLKVQAMDQAYTIQGWLKGVNANNLEAVNDPGHDGGTGMNANVARDAYSYSLGYFAGDYTSIGTSSFEASLAGSGFGAAAASKDLFNGNISRMITTIVDPLSPGTPLPQGSVYTYDQLNRIKEMQAFSSLSGNAWQAEASGLAYKSTYNYDANGNIDSLVKYDQAGNILDSLDYKYDWINPNDPLTERRLRSNKLYHVDELTGVTSNLNDLEDQGTFSADPQTINTGINNYQYDEIGNLIKDKSEQIAEIKWNVSGKITEVIREETSDKYNLEFLYDAMGNRTAKIVKPQASLGNNATWTWTWYTRDGSGNVIAIYEQKASTTPDNFDLHLKEQLIYGSSRVGMYKSNILLATRPTDLNQNYTPNIPSNLGFTAYRYRLGKKSYELSNHLGNILTVVSDMRIGIASGINIDYYQANILASTDYYPFGELLPGRDFHSTYRYGFNGKENDDEVGCQDYGFRIYNPRLARFLSVDPLTKEYPWYTPYQFAGNTPIQAIDLDGLEPVNLMTGKVIQFPTQTELKLLKSNDYGPWKDMLQWEKSDKYKAVFDEADKGRILDQQEMDWAFSDVLNTDYYAIQITNLPKDFNEAQLYDHIRKNLGSYLNNQRFSPNGDFTSADKWNSSDPTGSLMVFRDFRDNAAVLTSQAGPNHWVFTPVGTAWHWEHPLAGHREFGLTKNSDGTYTFYTRGVDLLWDAEDLVIGQGMFDFFGIADELWNGVMDNVAKEINDNGGTATKTHNFTRKIDWEEDICEEDK